MEIKRMERKYSMIEGKHFLSFNVYVDRKREGEISSCSSGRRASHKRKLLTFRKALSPLKSHNLYCTIASTQPWLIKRGDYNKAMQFLGWLNFSTKPFTFWNFNSKAVSATRAPTGMDSQRLMMIQITCSVAMQINGSSSRSFPLHYQR